jgi:hypothetical protein
MDEGYVDILIRIQPWNEAIGAYPVEAALDDGASFKDQPGLDRQALLAAELDPEAYGLELFDALIFGA